MLDALFECNRKVNLVFGVCVDVQNVAAPLAAVSFRIELLAHNGVVRAAQLDGIAGGPLIALTEFLSSLPKKIGPAVREIEELCHRLARVTADATNQIRVYFLLTRALLRMADQGVPERDRASLVALARADFTESLDLVRLVRLLELHHVTGASNVGNRCQASLQEVASRIREARMIFETIDDRLHELKSVALSSRYLASCMRIEVAHLPKEADGFGSFNEEIAKTLDHLESRLTELQRIESRGEALVRALAERIAYDAQ